MMWCVSGSYWSSLTPSATVMSGSVAGAEMTTFFAPASRCFCAPSRFVKKPVDSITMSTPRSRQGIAAGIALGQQLDVVAAGAAARRSRARPRRRTGRASSRSAAGAPSSRRRPGRSPRRSRSRRRRRGRAEEVAADAAEAIDAHPCLRHARDSNRSSRDALRGTARSAETEAVDRRRSSRRGSARTAPGRSSACRRRARASRSA